MLVWWEVVMNERSIQDAGQPVAPSKLVPFPVTPAVVSPPAKARLRPRKYWLIAGLLSLLVVAAAIATWWALSERTTVHLCHGAGGQRRGDADRDRDRNGQSGAHHHGRRYVSGVIQEIDCDFNTKVKKGQLCAKIDPRPYQRRLEQAQANVATAKAQLVKDRADLTYAKIAMSGPARLLANMPRRAGRHDVAKRLHQAQAQIAIDQATIQQRQARSTPRRSISVTPTSSRRSTARWCRAT